MYQFFPFVFPEVEVKESKVETRTGEEHKERERERESFVKLAVLSFIFVLCVRDRGSAG